MKLNPMLVIACLLLAPRPAAACGGFFCSTAPVEQSGEKILFAVDSTGVEVHVQINYQGSDAEFAWVVPTRQVPTLSVGVDAMFSALDFSTAPQFRVNVHQTGSCGGGGGGGFALGCGGSAAGEAASGGGADGGFGSDPGVTVIEREVVGPYDAVILQADNGPALKSWLRSSGYQLSLAGEALLDPYVREHDYFVALKLHPGRDASDIQPIVLRFAGGEPCIPIRLTAVAALNDMEVTAFLLGPARGVPKNYYEVTLDLARIDWMTYGGNYKQVISAAADEAGGNAFVTEFAGSARIMAGRLYDPSRFRLDYLRTLTDPAAYVQELLLEGFPSSGQMRGELRRWIPEPDAARAAGITEQQFYACVSCYRQFLSGFAFDPVGMTNELDAVIVQPLARAQMLFDRLPYLTRLYTLISPPEMTQDPTFAFNPDLPDVSSQHVAEAYLQCNNGQRQPIRLMLPDGRELWVDGRLRDGLDTLPAAESWSQMGASGPAATVGSNRDRITSQLASHNDMVRRRYPNMGNLAGAGDDSGCAAAPGARGTIAGALLAYAGVSLLVRRRRAGSRSRRPSLLRRSG